MIRHLIRSAGFTLATAAVLTLGLLVGCSENSDPTDPVYEKAGTFQLTLIDAPVAFDDIVLVIQGISVHRASEDSLDGWYGMAVEPAEYHLLDLTNGISAMIADSDLPAGTYDRIRLLLARGNRVVVDGQEYRLFIPSGLKRGLKIKHEFEIVEGETYAATLDIDAARSALESRDVRFDGDTMTIPDMVRLATFDDPDGNKLMLYQDLQKS